MKKSKDISLKFLIAIIIAVLVVILVVFAISKNKDTEQKTEIVSKEEEIIQNIRQAFDAGREKFVINDAIIEGYQPSKIDSDYENSPAVELKNIVVSALGQNVTDESQNGLSELNLESLKKSNGEKIEIDDGYHVYLVSGEDENEKFIDIIYKDSTFCHGMAYYDTENNITADTTDNLYPILVAQIRLSENDFSYYLEPMKSIK